MTTLNSSHSTQPHEQLDLAILNMDTHDMESLAQSTLNALPGIHTARIVERGAWIEYNPESISKEEITHALEQSGLRVGIFQDSKSGRTGHSTA
ncbi:MAG: hypothetical protein ABIP97_08220 [Chthoniobacterales bacterium]